MPTSRFDIVPIEDVKTASVLDALSAVFGPRSADWYRWKHVENPAGPSLGWVAVDDAGVIGVRLLQRWSLVAGNRVIRALRPVDTMTLPRAQRQGVFRALLHTALDDLDGGGEGALIFNTPNRNSRGGYERSGWTLLPVITHGRRFTTLGPRSGTPATIESLEIPEGREQGSITTLKSSAYLSWRYDPRAGHAYRAATAGDRAERVSIIYRVATRRRVRRLLLLEAFGPESLVRRLVAAIARAEGAAMTILAVGSGTGHNVRPHFRRGSSTLAVLPLVPVDPDPLVLDSWSLSLGDLEDVL